MTFTSTPALATPVRQALDHDAAIRLAAVEYARLADALAALRPEDWTRPTECPAWDVRQLACHTVGMAAMAASPMETIRQQRKAGARAKADGVDPLTALTAVQVEERADWAPERVVAEARAVGARATRGRRRTPGLVRRRTLPQTQDVGGRPERWTIGYLTDVILTRDPWMHRMDLAGAVGTPPVVTADHDGVVVADVVAEWAARHGTPYKLTLTGPAGGSWSHGDGGEELVLDAIDFCRTLSGRGSATGLLAVQVPF
jgi:uncharacterized protein (TIGR03083 family)